MPVELIESRSAFEDYLAGLGPRHRLAVDTEFFRETTYYPQLGLVQLAYDGKAACIDPLAFDARQSLQQVLLDPGIVKLFHSCSQDLEVLLRYLGKLPCPVHDTQVASALLNEKDQVSYADIVATHAGITLEKSQTRTNWLKRPLSSKQLEYAADDVLYIEPVYESLVEELDRRQRNHWFEYECRLLCDSPDRFEPDFDHVWLRVKGTQRLDGIQLAVVDALARWRESKAIEMDLARRMVIGDDCITAAAVSPPADARTLRGLGKVHRRLTDPDLEEALECIRSAMRTEPGTWPTHPRMGQTARGKALIKSLMATIERTARELGIAPSVLASRKEVEKLVEGRRDLGMLDGWRRDIIGDQLLGVVDEQGTSC